MDSSELRDQFRLAVDDTEETFLWSDLEVFTYMNDAQRMFCRLTNGLSDATSDITQLPIDIGEEWVDLSPLILKPRGAYRLSDGRDLNIINYEDLGARHLRFDGRQGPAQSLIFGMEDHKVRIYPIPNVADTAMLLVFRLPLETIDDEGQELEIDDQHHLHLLKWMKYLAYNKQDAETLDRTKAADSKAEFEAYCFQAKNEQNKARHKSGTVVYGGL